MMSLAIFNFSSLFFSFHFLVYFPMVGVLALALIAFLI